MSTTLLDIERYLQIPRLGEIDISPDGRFAVYTAARVGHDGLKFVRDVWRLRVSGERSPERLTLGESNDSSPRYLADASILFLSNRQASEPDAGESGASSADPVTQLWHLPGSGEPRVLSHADAGIIAFARARNSGAVIFAAPVHPGAADLAADRAAEKERKKVGASGLAFDRLPLRHWDHFFGPRFPHLFHAPALDALDQARDLTPQATVEHEDLGFDLAPDGTHAVACERQRDRDGRFAENLRLFDLAAGTSRLITTGTDSYAQPRFAPDSRSLVAVFHENTPGRSGRQRLVAISLAGDPAPRVLTPELDRWPESPLFTTSGDTVIFSADEGGHHPLFAVAAAGGKVTRLTATGAFSDAAATPDGATVVALASRLDRPPEIVALSATAVEGTPRPLHRPPAAIATSRLAAPAEIVATSADGRRVQAWLIRPETPPPAAGHPLLLWVHGGPLGAFADGWHWRWNPQLFAARGYAVLLVNPRISTGFGQDFIEEGFGRWGGEPFADLMAALDQALTLPGLDAGRTAAMGGSYGGYMANWIAGHSERFRCIVSHAGLWNLPGFHGATDWGPEWEREFGGDPHRHPALYDQWSPHRFAQAIRTPVLFVHGDKDYRVPVSEAYQGFSALDRLGVPTRLVYFPDENHWILRPPNIRQWHAEIFAWLDRWLGSAI